jgi:hypothetical protein
VRYVDVGLDDLDVIAPTASDRLVVLGGPIGVYEQDRYASKSAASRRDNIPATRRACPARARHSMVSDKPNLVTVRITVSQVARCWRRGVESSMLVIVPKSSPPD